MSHVVENDLPLVVQLFGVSNFEGLSSSGSRRKTVLPAAGGISKNWDTKKPQTIVGCIRKALNLIHTRYNETSRVTSCFQSQVAELQLVRGLKDDLPVRDCLVLFSPTLIAHDCTVQMQQQQQFLHLVHLLWGFPPFQIYTAFINLSDHWFELKVIEPISVKWNSTVGPKQVL